MSNPNHSLFANIQQNFQTLMSLVQLDAANAANKTWALYKPIRTTSYTLIVCLEKDQRHYKENPRHKWELCPPLISQVDWKGRKSGALVPAVDSQLFRHMVATGKLTFKHVAASSSSMTLSLNTIEMIAGKLLSFMDSNFRVILIGNDIASQGQMVLSSCVLPRMPSVTSFTSDEPTAVSDKIQDLYSLIWEKHNTDVHTTVEALKDLADALLVQQNSVGRGKYGGYQYGPQQMLATVRLSDLARDLEHFGDMVRQSMRLVLKPMLADHILSQKIHIPSRSTIYRHRLLMDLCSMVFSRRHLLQDCGDWICHLRADASPQFGKEYFVVELDRVDLTNVNDTTLLTSMKTEVESRLLPLQLLGQKASKTEHKVARLHLALSADCQNADTCLNRAYSCAFDMGVESKIFVSPACSVNEASILTVQTLPIKDGDALDSEKGDDCPEAVGRLCPRALPIGDSDHSLHHCLQELKSCFAHWNVFYSLLNALTKYFGNWSRLTRFRTMCIIKNDQFRSLPLRESFAAMFKTSCPSLQEQRWEYLHLDLT